MTHIDDWLDTIANCDPTLHYAWRRLEEFRADATGKVRLEQARKRKGIQPPKLFCTYNGKRYRCIGASRMGDIWLTRDFNRDHGYDLRIDVDDCSEWSDKS